MRSPEQALAQVESRLRKTWSQVLTGTTTWSPEFPLGTSRLAGTALAESWAEVHAEVLRWQEWVGAVGATNAGTSATGAPAAPAEETGLELVTRAVTVHRTPQALPSMLRVPSVDAAAALVGGDWPARLARGRLRHGVLTASFPQLDDPAATLRAVDGWTDVDFDLVCRAAGWFATNPHSGLTARQVPVEGIGTKWLRRRTTVVRTLAGLAGADGLGLVPGRPPRAHLTYLDPGHLAAGGRRHDVATFGDVDSVAYQPRMVLISENRDTAQLFPELEGGIAVEGNDVARSVMAVFGWIRAAEHVFYWGDMDAAGLEILDGFRAEEPRLRSIFMDLDSYVRWERFGVDHDHEGKPLGPHRARELEQLEPGERELYLALCSEDWSRHRRIEQERIPLAEAAAAVRTAMD